MSILNSFTGRGADIFQGLRGHSIDVSCCDAAPNFTLITGSSDKTVRVWVWKEGFGYKEHQNSPLKDHKYEVTCVRVSPQGTMMASSSVDGTAVLWNLHSLTKVYTVTQVNGNAIRVCSFSPDSTLLVTAGDNGAVCIWDLIYRTLIRTLFEPEGTTGGIAFTPDCQFLATGCCYQVIKLWHLQDLLNTTTESACAPLARIDNIHDKGVFSMDISSHIKLEENDPLIRYYSMATGGGDNEIKIWTITSKVLVNKNKNLTNNEVSIKQCRTLKQHRGLVTCVRYSTAGHHLVSGSLDQSVMLWDMNSQYEGTLATFRGHQGQVNCVAFSKDSTFLMSGSNDKLVMVWDLFGGFTKNRGLFRPIVSPNAKEAVEIQLVENNEADLNECKLLKKNEGIFVGGVNSCCFYGKDLLATGSGDNSVRLFRVVEENNIEELGNSPFKGHTDVISHVEFSRDGNKLASSSLDGCTFIWNPHTGEKQFSVPENNLSSKICRFSPNGRFIVTGGDDKKAVIWDAEAMKKISVLEGYLDTITSACLSPDNKILVMVSSNADYRIWQLDNGQCVFVKEDAHDGGIQSCDFSDNLEPIPNVVCSEGQSYLLATCGNDSMVRLWRISVEKASNNELNFDKIEVKRWRFLEGHSDNVLSVRFSPKVGAMVCSTAKDRQARLWSAYGGHCLQVLDHDSIVTCCSFSSDCSLLVTGCQNSSLWIWKLPQQLVFQTAIVDKLNSRSKTVANWSHRDVLKWLDDINMNSIAKNVRNTGLDGKKLLTLTGNEVCSGLNLDDETAEIMMKELKWLKKREFQIQKPFYIDLPDEILCPITHEIMREPVTCSDGFTYEKNAIAEWFMSGKFTSPITNEILRSTDFSPNLKIRDAILIFLKITN